MNIFQISQYINWCRSGTFQVCTSPFPSVNVCNSPLQSKRDYTNQTVFLHGFSCRLRWHGFLVKEATGSSFPLSDSHLSRVCDKADVCGSSIIIYGHLPTEPRQAGAAR